MGSREKLAEANFTSLDEMMAAYAEEATRVAWADHRRRLDFSESSVEVLEQILDGQSADDIEFQTRLWGGYLGELIRRRYAGEWELSQYPGNGGSQAPALVPAVVVRGSRLYPLIKVYRRLTLGAGEHLPGFYEMVAERLGKGPPVQ